MENLNGSLFRTKIFGIIGLRILTIRKIEPIMIKVNKIKILFAIKNFKGVKTMAHRQHTGSNDKKIFRNTAAKTKAINLAPKIMRGGIRL